MKKTIFSFLLIGSAAAVMAQQPTNMNSGNSSLNTNRNNTTNNTPTTSNNNSTNSNPANNNTMNPPTDPQTRMSNGDTSTNMNSNTQSNNGLIELSSPASNDQLNSSGAASGINQVNVPASIQTSFTTSYPSVTGNTWQQSGDWYVTRYLDNGAIKQVSYREDGKTLTTSPALVRNAYVPDNIMNQAIQQYGANVYSIGSVKGSNGQEMYAVTLIRNGVAHTQYMNQDGTAAVDYFRQPDNANMNSQQQSSPSQPTSNGSANQEGLNNANGKNSSPRQQ
jgi:hypothetical protein